LIIRAIYSHVINLPVFFVNGLFILIIKRFYVIVV
jgi:hypothetical protein